MKLNHIYQIAIHADDLDEAVSFYQDTLGAQFLAKYDPPGLVFFDFSGVRLLLEQAATRSTLYFEVDDIETAYAELQSKGVEFTSEPHLIHRDDAGVFGKPGMEDWMAFFNDPAGNILALAARKPGDG
jgi:methylmalonyl-CoA/ethylmalonyl-CoA epimerase